MAYVVAPGDPFIDVNDVLIVNEFTDVFLDNLPRMPHAREIEFTINVLSGTNSISLTPYCLTPTELRELKI